MFKVFISIINFNSKDVTLECLRSIEKLDKHNIELSVIVVDNASKDRFNTSIKFNNFKLKIINSNNNLGFSGGQNLGIKYALENGADYLVVLNNDTILDRDLISSITDSFSENIAMVSPKIYFAKGYEFHGDRYSQDEKGKVIWYAGGQMDWNNLIAKHRGVDEVDVGQYEKGSETDFATGCCMVVKADLFKKIGFFNEKYFLYYEDNDLSQRARLAGFDIYYQPKAVLWHKNAASVGGSGSLLQDYYITRNRMIFGFKYASLRSKLALVRESVYMVVNGRKWQKKGVQDYYLRKFGKGSYPL